MYAKYVIAVCQFALKVLSRYASLRKKRDRGMPIYAKNEILQFMLFFAVFSYTLKILIQFFADFLRDIAGFYFFVSNILLK